MAFQRRLAQRCYLVSPADESAFRQQKSGVHRQETLSAVQFGRRNASGWIEDWRAVTARRSFFFPVEWRSGARLCRRDQHRGQSPMNKPYTRLALFTGVSICALGASSPAAAAVSRQGEAPLPGETLVIGGIGGDASPLRTSDLQMKAALASGQGFFETGTDNQHTVAAGEELNSIISATNVEPGAPAFAFVDLSCSVSGHCSSSAPVVQRATNIGGSAANGLANHGTVEVGGLAHAQGGSAFATAVVQTAIWQYASASKASNELTNDGTLSVSLVADADATLGDARAFASVAHGGVTQTAIASGASQLAVNHLSNGGPLSIQVAVQASAAGSASAVGKLNGGIVEKAFGIGSAGASNELDNQGSISIGLSAAADAGANAFAHASAGSAIVQTASGRTAHDLLTNSGSIAIGAGAQANGATFASAVAVLHSAIFQTAGASGTGAAATIGFDNEGSLSLAVTAKAAATGLAGAEAVLERGIVELAGGDGAASVALGNSGAISMLASAQAVGASAASALVAAGGGILEVAGGSEASARLSNEASGELHIGAVGAATATDGNALAFVRLTGTSSGAGAIFGDAHATIGAAEATLANAGSISLAAHASAHAAGSTSSVGGRAIANAAIGGAIQEIAVAEHGAASAILDNVGASGAGGTINITAAALGEAESGLGYGFASVGGAIVESARGISAGASITNGGSINIAAHGNAAGTVAGNDIIISTTSSTFILPLPGGNARVFDGIVQQAQASAGTGRADSPVQASVGFDNDGSLTISAIARASADHMALASANLTAGLEQGAFALAGQAAAALDNSGSIALVASASAHGSAVGGSGTQFVHTFSGSTVEIPFTVPGAYALVNGGIVQLAVASAGGRGRGSASADGSGAAGGGAALSLDNSGTIDILARARADGEALASASAIVSGALVQNAIAALGSGQASLDNQGSLQLGAIASASATGSAYASAHVKPAILQVAGASGKGPDSVAGDRLANGATIEIGAGAFAGGATASALAGVGVAVNQLAQASFGDAAATLSNTGTLAVTAAASAQGSVTAIADAGVGSPRSGAIAQTAQAPAGHATDLLANSGTISLVGTARASAEGGWAQAIGHVNNGIVQNALGSSASAALDNSGTIRLQGAGHASGHSATGNGVIGGGIIQFAEATATIGKSSKDFDAVAAAGNAIASITNSGSISVSGIGIAEATGPARAVGFVGGAISQFASAGAGNASASLTNEEDITILAGASAAGAGLAFTISGSSWALGGASALASVSGGLVQVVGASSGDAAATLANSGSLSISAVANAAGAGIASVIASPWQPGTADLGPRATAVVAGAINQGAESFAGDASAALTNSGTISALASADATATGVGPASAHAVFYTADLQHAKADSGAASAKLGNQGTFSMHAAAHASVTASAAADSAFAAAEIFGGILALATGPAGATATLANQGILSIAALASALDPNGLADASAIASRALQLGADAASGDAAATLDNNGILAIGAAAIASGASADAGANVATGIAEFLNGAGTAAAMLSNAGSMTVSAVASAIALDGEARAGASITVGLGQRLFGGTGASAAIDNDGAIGFRAVSKAVAETADGAAQGPAVATAELGGVTFVGVHGVVSQDVTADSARAALTNSGSLSAIAAASASGSAALGAANLIEGIRQNLRALDGSATAELTNSGTMSFAAVAGAHAAQGPAEAVATVRFAVDQVVRAAGDATASITNSGSFEVSAQGEASGSGDSRAIADAAGAAQMARTGGSGSSSVLFDNEGDYRVAVAAAAAGGEGLVGSGSSAHLAVASASANALGVLQTASHIAFANSGTFSVVASALATGGDAVAGARATGIEDGWQSLGSAVTAAEFSNSGAIAVVAKAAAHGAAGTASAGAVGYEFEGASVGVVGANSGTVAVAASAVGADAALATARGIMAGTLGSLGPVGGGGSSSGSATGLALAAGIGVSGTLDNSGVISVSANASADHFAFATAGDGMLEVLAGTAVSQLITNSGTVDVAARAVATDAQFGTAVATAFDGIAQYAQGSSAAQQVGNDGAVEITASAKAHEGAVAIATAHALTAIYQQAIAGTATQAMTNAGSVTAIADASAVADGSASFAGAALVSAVAIGVGQATQGAKSAQSITNSGSIKVEAAAYAEAPGRSDPDDPSSGGVADAFALAIGAHQTNSASSGTQAFANAGTVDVHVVATVVAAGGNATAVAKGYFASDYGLSTQHVDISNDGTLNVAATAVSPARAYALARGIYVGNAATATSSQALPVTGSIENDGSINVVAIADGAPLIPGGPPASTFTFGGSSAFASGILVFGGANSLTITNSGSINVDAAVADGRTAIAMGIVALSNGFTEPGSDAVLTINNSGDIIVRQSVDGGETWKRGLAINVAGNPERGVLAASNTTVVNLLGGGNIYGNIALRAEGGDVINVSDGETVLDGIINPASIPADGISEADLDSGFAGVGTLNILDGGTLFLRDRRLDPDFADMYDGPSYAFIDRLNVAGDGTIAFELQPTAPGDQPAGTYSQVFTDSAKLDGGTLEARVTTASGLFADGYAWDNLIDANALSGTFDQCVLGGAYSGSVLLSLTCSYDSGANVDLALTRTHFGDVSGLNANGRSVGAGLECIYDVALTGAVAGMFGDLFKFDDPANYNVALNMLSGSVYANYLNSFPSLGVHYNDLADRSTDCEVPALAGSVLECRQSSPLHVWGQIDYQTRKADGDEEAGSGRSKRFTGLLGIDATVASSVIAGVEGGYVSNQFRDHQFGDSVKGNGWQVGGYAVWDPGSFFLKGMTTYSAMSGDSSRRVDWTDLAPGATFAGRLNGSPDVRMWTLGLHGGARLQLGGGSVVTPYVDYDYVRSTMDGFTESGLEGANLTVESAKANRSFLTGGVKWATRIGGVVPQLNLGYRYRFGNERSDFRALFDGDQDCDFDIVSAAQKKGAFLAGLSVGGKLGPVDLRIGYEGEFNGSSTSHSGNFRLVLPLGGHSATPPTIAPAPPPPPLPPSVAAPVAAQPALPPPAPVESGERG
jgi:hypothetical protein